MLCKRVACWMTLSLLSVIGCDPPQNVNPPPNNSTPTAPAITSEDSADRPVPEGFTQTDSGLRYKILKEGEGTRPTAENSVVANYRGWLDGGQEFDAGQAVPFPLNGVIKGWTEGLQLIGEGGKIELEIPPNLAYGASGFPPTIPPNAWLHFDVELVKVE